MSTNGDINSRFRGVLWPRDPVNGVHRCVIVGIVTSQKPFDLPNQAIVNASGVALIEAIRSMPYHDDSTPIGDASDVLMSLNQSPFTE